MIDTFAKDVYEGLTAPQKYLSSKYFYDANGSRIFKEIMDMPEYYLTDAEFEILSMQPKQIHDALGFSTPFNIIELGAGDGFKTFKLLDYLVNAGVDFNYMPVDISKEAMGMLTKRLKERLPNLSITPKIGDYFEILKETKNSETPNLLLFLGSNIGNYQAAKAQDLLRLFHANMKTGDKLLIGLDLKKHPRIIQDAYADSHGITKRFNINLLLRINRELGADFKLDDFDFYAYYNPENGAVKSYIVSLKAQKVYIKHLDTTITFDYNELISTELSQKYSLEDVEQLANATGFIFKRHFLDCKHYFTDALWEK